MDLRRRLALLAVALVAASATAPFPTSASEPDPAPAWPNVSLTEGSGAFGQIVTTEGKGAGGWSVMALDADGNEIGSAVCPVSTMADSRTPALGSCPTSGLWVITGLPPSTPIQLRIQVSNEAAVRPSASISVTTPQEGAWVDASWVVPAPNIGGAIPLPLRGSAAITGSIEGEPVTLITGTGSIAAIASASERRFVGATSFLAKGPATPAVRPISIAEPPQPSDPGVWLEGPIAPASGELPIAAPSLDTTGSYCFGVLVWADSVCGVSLATRTDWRSLPPDQYLVTALDDRPVPSCGQSSQATGSNVFRAPCGYLPSTSQTIIARADSTQRANVRLDKRTPPGAPPSASSGEPSAAGLFGVVWNGGVSGGAPVGGVTVSAVPVACPGTPICAATPLSTMVPTDGISPDTFVQGPAGEALLTSLADLARQAAPDGPSDPAGTLTAISLRPEQSNPRDVGVYRITGLQPGVTYAVLLNVPDGFNGCRPNEVKVDRERDSGSPYVSPTVRCATLVTAESAGEWAAGADFVLSPD